MHQPTSIRVRPSTSSRSRRSRREGTGRRHACRALAGALIVLALTACGASVTATHADAPAQPASAFSVSPTTPLIDVAVTFDARAIECAAAPCTFVWDDVTDAVLRLGEGDVLMVTFPGEGPKRVRLTVTDADGRAVSHEAELDVLATEFTPVPRPSVPEFVTPPGDEPLTRPPHGRGLERRPIEPPGLTGRGAPEHARSPKASH